MRINIRPVLWTSVLAVAATMVCSPIASAHQRPDYDGRSQDNDHNDNYASNADFQRGLIHGRDDGANRRAHQYRMHPDNSSDRRAYEMGYDQGYQNNYHGNGTYQDRRDGNNDRRDGNYGRNQNPGYQMGFRDGSTDGRNDRNAGRPLKYGLGYKHPDRGYQKSDGDKKSYEQQYRLAYQDAYRQSYGGRRR